MLPESFGKYRKDILIMLICLRRFRPLMRRIECGRTFKLTLSLPRRENDLLMPRISNKYSPDDGEIKAAHNDTLCRPFNYDYPRRMAKKYVIRSAHVILPRFPGRNKIAPTDGKAFWVNSLRLSFVHADIRHAHDFVLNLPAGAVVAAPCLRRGFFARSNVAFA